MTTGLPCDRDGYDLRIIPCPRCLSRGCDWECVVALDEPVHIRHSEHIPNRLFGTYINEDGEAV